MSGVANILLVVKVSYHFCVELLTRIRFLARYLCRQPLHQKHPFSGSTTLSRASSSTVCVQRNHVHWLWYPPMSPYFLDVILGNRVETAVERLVELDVLLLRAFHVHHVDRFVVRMKMYKAFYFVLGFLFKRLTSVM